MPKTISKSPKAPVAIVEQPIVTPAPKPDDKLTRGGTSSGRPGQIVTAANRWRENYNPIRGLTMRRAAELLEMGQRGDFAYLQWTYRMIERRHATLKALVARCLAPLINFEWEIKVLDTLPAGATKAMAEAQKQSLKDAYDGVDNLKAAIKHLALADFRGYSQLQKHRTSDGDVYHLEPLHQWCICRDGLDGNWFWNPDSRSTSAPLQFLGKAFCIGGEQLPLEDFIIRECDAPIDEIAIINFVRQSLCEKDADGFIEIYGIPGGVVTMPANVPPQKEAEYETAAKLVAEGGSGAIPAGSSYAANDGPRGVDPFTPRFKHLDEQLVIAGTGGLLTMLAQSGSGTLAGNAHSETFQDIAESIGLDISEVFQDGFDAGVLADQHPGEPMLVYFALGAKAKTDVASLIKDVSTLFAADKVVDADWLSEQTSYPITDAEPATPPVPPNPPTPPVPPKPGVPPQPIRNRAGAASDPATSKLAAAVTEDLHPAVSRLIAISEIQDDALFMKKLKQFHADFPQLQMDILKDPSADRELLPIIAAGFIKGLKGAQPTEKTNA